jgi:hypothetical protein
MKRSPHEYDQVQDHEAAEDLEKDHADEESVLKSIVPDPRVGEILLQQRYALC